MKEQKQKSLKKSKSIPIVETDRNHSLLHRFFYFFLQPIYIQKQLLNVVLVILLFILALVLYQTVFLHKYYPLTYIGNNNVTFLTKEQAFNLLQSQLNQRIQQPLNLTYDNQNYVLNFSPTDIEVNYMNTVQQTFSKGHEGSWFVRLQDQFQLLIHRQVVQPQITVNIEKQLALIEKKLNEVPQDATVWLDENNQVHLTPGQSGKVLHTQQFKEDLTTYLLGGNQPHTIPITVIEPTFSEKEAAVAKKALEFVQQSPVELTYEQLKWTIDVPTLYYLLNLGLDETSLLDQKKLSSYVQDLATKIDVQVQEPLFKFDQTNQRVTAFRPAQEGKAVNVEQTMDLITQTIEQQNTKTITLPVMVVQPKIQTAEINNLGIKDLLGRGISYFSGSIENRIFNINHTAAKINGILIPPGEVFSFNRTVGDISAATGFKQAYVIKSGRTVLDDGGGVCQDSTTLFRAALNAGLPIVERTAHAYRVSYYEQGGFGPGLDATIFHPTVDFKFKNDTVNYILIQAYTQGTTLYIDLYGTSDGRVAQVTKPTITDQTPPPPELRQDDPTLPRGIVKQVDWAAWGAKVSFQRTVTKNGETIANETWRSSYRPWQAVYLVGTKD